MSYEQFVMGYRRYTTTARSLSEAFRDADYATPIWRCETDYDRTKHYLQEIAIFAALFVVAFSIFGSGLYAWITR